MNMIVYEVEHPPGHVWKKLVASRRSLVKVTKGRLPHRNITKWSVEASRRSLVMRDTFPHLVVSHHKPSEHEHTNEDRRAEVSDCLLLQS
jgi:hypothetical protein